MNDAYLVDGYIDQLPDVEREIAEILRNSIRDILPEATEKFSFKLPFYHYHGMFCYINYIKKGGGVELAFCRGKDLLLAFPELDLKNRTMIAGITFHNKKDVDRLFVSSLIAEAAAWQSESWQNQRPFIQRKKNKNKE
jgi:hypothetical protein